MARGMRFRGQIGVWPGWDGRVGGVSGGGRTVWGLEGGRDMGVWGKEVKWGSGRLVSVNKKCSYLCCHCHLIRNAANVM